MTTTIENKIAKSIEEQKLPALTGSVKQIAWATDIRAKNLASIKESFDRIQANLNDDAKLRKNAIAYQALLNVLLTKVESKFWIDNRFTAAKSLIVANNLQDAYKAEFERLGNEGEVKAEVKAETDGSEDNPDDQKDVYKLLPAIDTLNDVDTNQTKDETAQETPLTKEQIEKLMGAIVQEREEFYDALEEVETNEEISQSHIDYLNGEIERLGIEYHELWAQLDKLNNVEENTVAQVKTAELAKLKAEVNNTQAAFIKAQDAHEQATDALKNFLNDTAFKLKQKLDALPLDYTITLKKTSGATYHFPDFSEIYIGAYHIGCDAEFHFEDWRGRTIARYNTPTQVETVIHMLKTAIQRGNKEFTFPTVDELNTPPQMPPCAPKSPDITQANKNEHKPEKSVNNPLEYWVSNDYGNFAKRKRLTHPRGKKFYFVDWDKTNYRNYWLTYTRDEDEDKLLLGDQQHIWVKIPRNDAVDLVKRGGQRTSVTPSWFVDCATWFFDWSDMPIFPYVVKVDPKTVNPKNIYINKKSHTVEEC